MAKQLAPAQAITFRQLMRSLLDGAPVCVE